MGVDRGELCPPQESYEQYIDTRRSRAWSQTEFQDEKTRVLDHPPAGVRGVTKYMLSAVKLSCLNILT